MSVSATAKVYADGALTFIESAKKALTGVDDIMASGVQVRPELISGITETALMLLDYAETHARLASQTLDASTDGGAS